MTGKVWLEHKNHLAAIVNKVYRAISGIHPTQTLFSHLQSFISSLFPNFFAFPQEYDIVRVNLIGITLSLFLKVSLGAHPLI